MKCTNRLEKLAVLGTLLLATLPIRGEGTLPIPISSEELPLTLNGQAVDGSNRRNVMEVSVDQAYDNVSGQLKNRCRGQENFYPAGGRIVLGSDNFNIKGICSPGATPSGQRQIIAISGGELVQLDGVLSGAPATTFSGTMKRENMGGSAPADGGSPQRFRFDLTRSGF